APRTGRTSSCRRVAIGASRWRRSDGPRRRDRDERLRAVPGDLHRVALHLGGEEGRRGRPGGAEAAGDPPPHAPRPLSGPPDFLTPRHRPPPWAGGRPAASLRHEHTIPVERRGEAMSPLTQSNNLAARMGRWSAGHWKTAVFGWLAFVIA